MEHQKQIISPLDQAFMVLDVVYKNDKNAYEKRAAAIAEVTRLVVQAALEAPELGASYWTWQASQDLRFNHREALGPESVAHYASKTLMVERFSRENQIVSDEEFLESQYWQIDSWCEAYEYNEGQDDGFRDFE